MGISANQARLLSLTARKCDLETQMQVILNNKLNIAKETSSIANNYNEAISNRRLFVFKPSINNPPVTGGVGTTESIYQDLSAKNLYNTGGLVLAQKIPGGYQQVMTNDDSATIEKNLRDGIYFLMQAATLQTQDPKIISFSNAVGGYLGGSAASGVTLSADTTGNTKWELVDWRDSTQIMDQLDKSDDESAKANYEKAMNEINEKEAQMDVEMNEIETQHSAISNELESTKKIMTKNTEDSFKYFS